jgi:peptidoglycan/LPS O-acetylase OafA/YrhL
VTTPRFAFRFVSTRRDILDGLGASLTARTGMRRWIRFAVIALGVAWLAGVVAVLFTDARPQAWWQPVLWAVLGGGIVWSFALHPWRMRRHILATTPPTQPQVLEFSDTGIEIDAEGVGRRRPDDLR